MSYHNPVLLQESVTGLNINPEGIYVDVTFGGGGHSREILKNLTTGKLIAFDQDADALSNLPQDDRIVFVQHNFKFLRNFLKYYGYPKVNGILADLGVSSHQFDEAARGFTFRNDALLDMRMNQQSSVSAHTIINQYSEAQLADIFYFYGEIQNAKKLASIIHKSRQNTEIKLVSEFLEVIKPCTPAYHDHKFLAQVFQAIRIEVNGELEALKMLLTQAQTALIPGGRLVVITYHSLEDRLVKNFIKTGNFEGKVEKDFYGNVKTAFKQINKNVMIPSGEELERNNRARSAKLRIAELLE